jgi:hypothetical protein
MSSITKFKSAASKVKVTHILAEKPGSKYEHADAEFHDHFFWALRFNLCTQFGMQQTLTPITKSVAHVYEGVDLDDFGNPPRDADGKANQVVKLNPDIAYQLSVRMEKAGKSFSVPALDWTPLERAEHNIPLVRRMTGRPSEPASHPSLLGQGEIDGSEWTHFSFQVDDSWAFLEIFCEAHGGCMTLMHGR